MLDELINDRLTDTSTTYAKLGKKHTTLTHLGCVLLRIFIGFLIYFKVSILSNLFFLIPFFLLIIIFFSYKLYITKNKTWKVYLRTILIYSISLIISILDKKNNRNNAGILIMIDALMGLQSRHIQKNFNS